MRKCLHAGEVYYVPNDGRGYSINEMKRMAKTSKRGKRAPAALARDAVFETSDTRTLEESNPERAAPRSAAQQALDNHRTRHASATPNSLDEALARRAELEANALEHESQARAFNTDRGYKTARKWWNDFVAFILLPVQILIFDHSCPVARAAVTALCRQFLCFTFRSIGKHRVDSEPADPDTALTYWNRIVRMHKAVSPDIDLSFTADVAKRWRDGAKRAQTFVFGPRRKKKKAMFSLQHIADLYEASWYSLGGRTNAKRRIRVLKAAPQLAIQVLFRASEYLSNPKENFSHTVHLSRDHITYYSWDWSHEYKPEELTPETLTALLNSGKARALVRMPRLKNDQFLDRGFPPASLELSEGTVCALRYLLLMEIDDPLTSEKARRAAPMFIDPDTGRGLTKLALRNAIITLTRYIFDTKYKISVPLKEILRQWSLHSFRVTGQNLLREAGVDEYIIRQAGRWLSNCVLQYDRPSMEKHAAATSRMSEATATTSSHLTIPGMTTYPYPIRTLHPSLSQYPESNSMVEPGVFTASPESQRRAYFKEPTTDMANSTEIEAYRQHLKAHSLAPPGLH